MYKELWGFFFVVARQRSLVRDGELWTAAIVAAISVPIFHDWPVWMQHVADHFNDLLTVLSIVFGFVLTALGFHVQAAQIWRRDERVSRVADLIVDWHVWTLLWLLFTLGSILVLWGVQGHLSQRLWTKSALYSGLVFTVSYSVFQILNHVLTVWWVFRNRDRLVDNSPPASGPCGS